MNLNQYLDHTLLRPDATDSDVENLCREAYDFNFRCVVVAPIHVSMASGLLRGSDIKTCSVVSFPMGATQTEIKIAEAVRVEADGAQEIDVVANLGWIQSGQFPLVTRELLDIRRRLAPEAVMKVIIETPLIKPELWMEAANAVIRSGAQFVKTATGFYGATTRRHVEQLKEYCGNRIKIKAAGGIRTAADAISMIAAGAARIGSSSSVSIMRDLPQQKKSDSQ
jgi:deoxyribose-phosphate aldolase